MEAVGSRGLALQYASRELRGDRDIVSRAVQDPPEALKP